VLRTNAALRAFLGYEHEELARLPLNALDHPDEGEASRLALRRLLAGEIDHYSLEKRYVHAAGHTVRGRLSISLVRDAAGRPLYVLGQVVDVTEQRALESDLRSIGERDALTGLASRMRLEQELERALAQAGRYGPRGALLLLAASAGEGGRAPLPDAVAVAVATCLRARLRATDLVAHAGDDHFAVLLPEGGEQDALALAAALLGELRDVLGGGGGEGSRAAVGVAALADCLGLDAADAIANAALALREAELEGGDRPVAFAAERHGADGLRARIGWVQRLRGAIADGGFELHAQPIVDLASGAAVEHQLTLWLRGEDGRLAPPDAFAGVAERVDLAPELDRHLAVRAIALAAERARDGDVRPLVVPLSARSLGDHLLLDAIARELARSTAPAASLVFAVQEAAALASLHEARAFAERLSALGCGFALDAFGAGFGWFRYVEHLPVELLRLDGELVRRAAVSRADRLALRAIADVARGLGRRAVATGVDDDSALALCRDCGLDLVQGLLPGAPLPAARAGGGRTGRARAA
jgi:PAS domain S-box-containing protein